jgi:hypothetical protein
MDHWITNTEGNRLAVINPATKSFKFRASSLPLSKAWLAEKGGTLIKPSKGRPESLTSAEYIDKLAHSG